MRPFLPFVTLLLASTLHALRGLHPQAAPPLTLTCIPRDSPASTATTVPAARINDDYCDCLHGEDEPGTSACPDGVFWCRNARHVPRRLQSSRVDDAVCDCCDGSDEPPGACPDTCAADAARYRTAVDAMAKAIRSGAAIRASYAVEASRSKELDERELKSSQRELDRLQNQIISIQVRVDGLKKRKEYEESVRKAREPHALRGDDPSAGTVETGQGDSDYVGSVTDYDDMDDAIDDDMDDDDELEPGHEENIEARNTVHDQASKERAGQVNEEENEDEYLGEADDDEDDEDEEMEGDADDLDEGDADLDDITDMKQVFEEEEMGFINGEKEANPAHSNDGSGDGTSTESSNVGEQLVTDASSELQKMHEAQEEVPEADLDTMCAELVSKGPNVLARRISFLRAFFTSKLRRLLPIKLQGTSRTSESQIEDCLQKAENAKWDLESKKRELKEKIDKLKRKEGVDYGPDGALRKLDGTCTKKMLGQYEFEICPFDLVRQYEHGSAIAILGRFKEWEGEGTDRKMSYPGGDHCWNGPARSIKVELLCGKAEDIISVDEPNRCAYTMKFETPAVCDEKAADAILAELEQTNGAIKEEL